MTLTLDKISYQNIFEQISPHRCKIESPLSQKYFTKWKENMSRSRGPAGNYNHVLYFHDEHFVILSPPHYSDGAGAGGPSDWTLGAQIFVKIGFCCLHLPCGHWAPAAARGDTWRQSSLVPDWWTLAIPASTLAVTNQFLCLMWGAPGQDFVEMFYLFVSYLSFSIKHWHLEKMLLVFSQLLYSIPLYFLHQNIKTKSKFYHNLVFASDKCRIKYIKYLFVYFIHGNPGY